MFFGASRNVTAMPARRRRDNVNTDKRDQPRLVTFLWHATGMPLLCHCYATVMPLLCHRLILCPWSSPMRWGSKREKDNFHLFNLRGSQLLPSDFSRLLGQEQSYPPGVLVQTSSHSSVPSLHSSMSLQSSAVSSAIHSPRAPQV